jgi:hypothetical protein
MLDKERLHGVVAVNIEIVKITVMHKVKVFMAFDGNLCYGLFRDIKYKLAV